MSTSTFLYCVETTQAVHAAESSSGWFRGPTYGRVLGAFCLAHVGFDLKVAFELDETVQNSMDYDTWTAENVGELYAAFRHKELVPFEITWHGANVAQEGLTSTSIFLYCVETMQAVHAAETSSGGLLGPNRESVLGAFCRAHGGYDLKVARDLEETVDNSMDYDVWTAENAVELYGAFRHKELVPFEKLLVEALKYS
ncbi:hypothetical protein RAS12_30740 (plasmid) [Achromobacter seleniivolatilans]|uniref:Uncharacterized protein n=1 Tax=Achromobacter seleniivolatilans TaxID=3047478 RepID=A0ABY9MBI9_9BURK|nr:hypothetical protein [Achromobacter sp. R39]WMD24012.1 hypothetical protein RAS12_30740 [Achromobacter sp. R39]